MSCCGSQRRLLAEGARRLRHRGMIYFEYRGETGTSVLGAGTGRRYYFDAIGVRVAVDERDKASVAAVPMMREVQSQKV